MGTNSQEILLKAFAGGEVVIAPQRGANLHIGSRPSLTYLLARTSDQVTNQVYSRLQLYIEPQILLYCIVIT